MALELSIRPSARNGPALALALALTLALAAVLLASSVQAAPRPYKAPACCQAPAGTVVVVELAAPVSTKDGKHGDRFPIRLAEPVVVKGRILLPAGTKGEGRVVQAARPGLGGKGAKLVLAAQWVDYRGRHIRLNALQLSGAGRQNGAVASAAGLTGLAFAPLGFAALAIKGGDVTLPAGSRATAKLSQAVFLTALGPAPKDYPGPVEAQDAPPAAIGEPPAGKGQIVFFRKKSLLGTGQWFNVREDGKALGKLTNGAWFTLPAEPGQHTYTASLEPEFKDKLTLQVDAGETYFVEGGLAKGVVISTAVLSPSDRTAFDQAAKGLKPAEGPGDDKAEAEQGAAGQESGRREDGAAPAGGG